MKVHAGADQWDGGLCQPEDLLEGVPEGDRIDAGGYRDSLLWFREAGSHLYAAAADVPAVPDGEADAAV